MEKKYILLLIVIILAIFLYTGNRFAEQKIEIADCSATFNTDAVTVSSSLCPAGNTTCVAQPGDQQNNAVVDVVTCACQKAKEEDYSNAELNSRIGEVVQNFFGYSVSAQQLCEQPGLILVKRSYG